MKRHDVLGKNEERERRKRGKKVKKGDKMKKKEKMKKRGKKPVGPHKIGEKKISPDRGWGKNYFNAINIPLLQVYVTHALVSAAPNPSCEEQLQSVRTV